MTQREEILKDIKKITRDSEIQDYLMNNVPYELLMEDEFVGELISVNSRVKNVLEMAKIYMAEEKKTSLENRSNARTNEERIKIDERNMEKIHSMVESGELLEDKEALEIATRNYREVIFTVAEECKSKEKYEEAEAYYKAIVDNGQTVSDKFVKKYAGVGTTLEEKDTLYYKSNIGRLFCKSKYGELTDEEREEINNDIEVLTSKQESKEAFLSFLEQIPCEKIDTEILKQAIRSGYKTQRKRSYRKNRTNIGSKEDAYIPELAPERIIEFIVKKYNVARAYEGKCGLAGYTVFDIEDKNVYIAEKFFKPGENGELVPNTGAATYIINKDSALDIEELQKGKIAEKKKDKNNKEVESVNHRNITYYDRLEKRVETVSKARISQEKELEDKELEENKEYETDIKEQLYEVEETKKEVDGDISGTEDKSVASDTIDKELEEYNRKLERMNELNEEFEKINFVLKEARAKQNEVEELTLKVQEIREEKNKNLSKLNDKSVIGIIQQQLKLIKELNHKINELNLVLEELNIEELEIKAKNNREEYQRLEAEIRDF